MTTYSISAPDGKTYKIDGPAGATQEQVQAEVIRQNPHLGGQSESVQQPIPAVPEQSYLATIGGGFGKGVGNVALGAQKLVGMGIKGLGGIGTGSPTLSDLLKPKLNPVQQAGQWLINDAEQGKQAMTQEYAPYKAANPITAGASETGGEIASTLPVGGAIAGTLGKALSMTPKAISASPTAAKLIAAIESGGMSLGNAAPAVSKMGALGGAALRAVGGGTMGAGQAALLNPDEIKQGAITGAAFPIVVKGAAPLVKATGNALADIIGGIGTHTGGETIKDAFKAGVNKSQSFLDNMRGDAQITDAFDKAKMNLANIARQRGDAYRSGMLDIKNDASVLNFSDIDKAINNAFDVVTFKGQTKNAAGAEIQQRIARVVDEWKNLPGTDYHTPEGLDALKQKIGGIVDSIPMEEKTARKVGDNIYSSVRETIAKQAPTYEKVMSDYHRASDMIKEMERTLSLSPNASVDTSIRKLQSLSRNNANTNYGNRLALGKTLEEQGGIPFISDLSGQALNSLAPRGLGKIVAGGSAAGAFVNPMALASLPLQSPRLMGEAAYGLGSAKRIAGKISDSAINKLSPAQKNALATIMQNANKSIVPMTTSTDKTQ